MLWIWWLNSHLPLSYQNSIKPCNGACIASLHQLDPEYNQSRLWIPSPHVIYQLKFLRRVLIRMAMRFVRSVGQRVKSTVIPLPPAVNVLPVCFVLDSCFCYPVFLRIIQQRLTKAHVLCYLVHSEWDSLLYWFLCRNKTVTQALSIRYSFLSLSVIHQL